MGQHASERATARRWRVPGRMLGAMNRHSTRVAKRRGFFLAAFAMTLAAWLGCACSAFAAGPPEGYPSTYGAVISAARDEGKVVVYSTTDLSAVAALIRDF